MPPLQLQQKKLKYTYPFSRAYFPLRNRYHPGLLTSEKRRYPLKPLQAGFETIGSRRYLHHLNSRYNSVYTPYYYPHRTHYRDWSRKLAKESVVSRRLDIIRKQNAPLQNRNLHQGDAGVKFFVTGIRPPGQWMNEANVRLQTGHPDLHLVGKSSLQQNIATSSAPYEKQSPSSFNGVVGKNKYQETHFPTPNIRFHQKSFVDGKGNAASLNSNRLGIPLKEKNLQNQNQALKVMTKQVPAALTKGTLTEASDPAMRSSLQTSPYSNHVSAALTTNDKANGLIKSENLEGATLGPYAHSLLQQNVSPKLLALQAQDTSPKRRQGPSSGSVQNRHLPQSGLKALGNVKDNSSSTPSHPNLGLDAMSTPQIISIQPTTPEFQLFSHTLTSPLQRHFQNGGSARGSSLPPPALVAQANNATEILVGGSKVNLKNGNNDLSHNVMRTTQLPVKSPGIRKTQPLMSIPSNYVNANNKLIAPRPSGPSTFTSTFKNSAPKVMLSPTLPNKSPYHIKNTWPRNTGVNNALSNRELALKNILFPPVSAPISPGLLTTQRIPPNVFQRSTMSQQQFRSPAPTEQQRQLLRSGSAFPSKKQIPHLSGNDLRVNRLDSVNVPLTRQEIVSSYQQNNILRDAHPSYKKSIAAQHVAMPFENSFPIVLHKVSPYFKMKRNLMRIANEQAKERRRLLELQRKYHGGPPRGGYTYDLSSPLALFNEMTVLT